MEVNTDIALPRSDNIMNIGSIYPVFTSMKVNNFILLYGPIPYPNPIGAEEITWA